MTEVLLATLGGLALLGLALIPRRYPRTWWLLILGGALVGLALTLRLNEGITWLCLALAASFSLLYLQPAARGGRRWAIYPAIGFILLTIVANDPRGELPKSLVIGALGGLSAAGLWWCRHR